MEKADYASIRFSNLILQSCAVTAIKIFSMNGLQYVSLKINYDISKPPTGDNGLDSSKTLKKTIVANATVKQSEKIYLMIPKLEYGSTLNGLVKPSKDENNLKVNNQ